ncbi:MAG: hypothetical protein U9Q06_01850 [Nanoarchaeota archaeon]|nr:hypothetical protein [Nanoarchaeota archaeon]
MESYYKRVNIESLDDSTQDILAEMYSKGFCHGWLKQEERPRRN